jgi:hypothetical protein
MQTHVEGMLDIMQANSINRLTIDWPALRATVSAEAASAATFDQLYPAIRTALRLLGDGHSSYRSPGGDVLFVPTRSCLTMGIGTVDVPANVGYVRVRSFSGTAAEGTAFADALQRGIQDADHDGMTGWIVDVRGNGGGNMWPMVAGVGPVLGEGVAGYFIDPVGAESVWEYSDGASRLGNAVLQAVNTPYRLRRERPRVARSSSTTVPPVLARRRWSLSSSDPIRASSAWARAECPRRTADSPSPRAQRSI